MESRLAASPKLRGALAKLMDEAFKLGYIPSINNTKSEKLCLIISNEDSGKCALLGTMINRRGNTEVVACIVNVSNWLWAECEGFSRDEIVDNCGLYNKVFKKVPVNLLAGLLS